jgi:uncharacterized membrane protein
MVYCGKCGVQVDSGSKFCASCGAEISVPQAQTQQESTQDQFADAVNKFTNTADTTADYNKNDIEQNKVMAVLAYLGILVIVPIIAAPKSKFARFHSNQGLVLLISWIIYAIVYSIISTIVLAISWRLAFIVTIIGLVSILLVILAIIGIINAATGKAKELPVIGKIRILK